LIPVATPTFSNAEKAAVSEAAFDTLTLLLSRGELHAAQPLPDDQGVDRVLVRLGSPVARALQIKTGTSFARGRYLQTRVEAPPYAPRGLDGFYLMAAPLLPHSPWVGPDFFLVPGSALGPVPANRMWRLSFPLKQGRGSRWDAYRRPIGETATALSQALDGGPAYPPPRSPDDLGGLSAPARGRILENEAACLITVGSAGRVHAWRPFSDEFGQDMAVTDETRSHALRIQVKGTLGLDKRGRVHAHVYERTFRPARYNLVLILWYDVRALRLADYGWLLRADEFAALRLPRRKDGALQFMAQPRPDRKNMFRPWLYRVDEIAHVLETALTVARREGPRASLPTARREVCKWRRDLGLRPSVAGSVPRRRLLARP
jgi:hypothetical protein